MPDPDAPPPPDELTEALDTALLCAPPGTHETCPGEDDARLCLCGCHLWGME